MNSDPNYKRNATVATFVILAALFGFALGQRDRLFSRPSSPAPLYQPVAEEASNAEERVHVTRTGKRYHRAGCDSLRYSDTVVTLSEAQGRGLTPCRRCYGE